MRTRRYANVEKIRSKERRLVELLRRQEQQKILTMFPLGISPATPLEYNAATGSSTVSIFGPLLALVHVPEMTFQVDYSETPDPTGGFADVTIAAGKQLASLREDTPLSLSGQSAGTYIVYATHNLAEENAETRQPPGRYAEGEGVFPEHASFYNHGQPIGAAIPRNNYDSNLSPETVTELVDRLTISIAREDDVPSQATRLLRVQWDGSGITSVTHIAQTVDIAQIIDRISALEGSTDGAHGSIGSLSNTLNNHIGSRGSAHSNATTSEAGFMSAADKTKLNGVEAGAQKNPSVATGSSAGLMSAADKNKLDAIESGAERNPGNATTGAAGLMSAADKAKLNGIQQGAQANPGNATTSASGLMSAADKTKLNGIESGAQKNHVNTVLSPGIPSPRVFGGEVYGNGTPVHLPSGWSVTREEEGRYRIHHNLGNANYVVIPTSYGGNAAVSYKGTSSYFGISISGSQGYAEDHQFQFILLTVD